MNETNSVAIPYLDQVLKANDALLGLPALPLVLVLAIAIGYLLKFIPVYPNNWVPIGVILGAVLANVVIAISDGKGNYARAVIYGIIVGVASIAIHRKWLKDWLDPKMFGAFLLCGLMSVGLVGCTTTPTARQLGIIKQVAYNGTYFALQEKPLWRPGFVLAKQEFRAFSASTNDVGMTEIVAIINRLPVKELSSDKARLFVNNGVLLLEQVTGGSAIPAEKLATPRQIAGALADGIELGTE